MVFLGCKNLDSRRAFIHRSTFFFLFPTLLLAPLFTLNFLFIKWKHTHTFILYLQFFLSIWLCVLLTHTFLFYTYSFFKHLTVCAAYTHTFILYLQFFFWSIWLCVLLCSYHSIPFYLVAPPNLGKTCFEMLLPQIWGKFCLEPSLSMSDALLQPKTR